MAGKYALYLPYKVLDALSNGNVTDSQFREFIMGLVEYDKSGAFPASHTAGFAMMFELLKPDLDFAKAKYEDIIEKRRNAGKQGGAPKGNKNAVGNRGGGAPAGNQNAKKDAPDQEPEKQTQAKQADNSNQLSVVSNQYTDKRSSSGEVVFSKQPPQTTTTFMNVCKKIGYHLDRKKAAEILNTGIDPAWFSGSFTFPEFIAGYIQNTYQNKPQHEKRNLFMALLAKEDKKDAFLEWRKNKEAETAAQEERHQRDIAVQERRRKLGELRKTGPQKCGNCGGTIPAPEGNRGTCHSCKFDFVLIEERLLWEFEEPNDFRTEWDKHMSRKQTVQAAGQ
jgi:hypothetical protein